MQEDFKILIIDDNKELAQNLSDILRVNDYNVTIVYDGKSAIEKCSEKDFQLAVLDIKLPDIDGLKLAEELSKISPVMEFIIITGYGTMESASEAVRLRKILAYETKPIDMNRFISLLRQIVERRRAVLEKEKAEESLRKSGDKLRTIINHSNELFYIHDTEHQLEYVSTQSEEIFGYKPEEMMVKWTSLITDNPINKEGFEITEKAIKTGERQKPYILEVKRKDGELRFVEIDESPIKDENGKVVAVSGALRDITESKQAEEELRFSKVLLRDVMDLVPVFICAKNLDGRFMLVNKKLTDFYGTTVEEMTGMLHADLCENENELRAMLADDREVIKSGKLKFIPEETMKNPDGSINVLETYKIPFTVHGEPAVLIAAADITERKKAEEELKKLLAELERSNKELEQFAYVASHDLQEPLRTVSNYVQLLSERYKNKLDKNADDFIVFITDAVGRMQSLIKDLLTLSRVGTSKKEFKSIDLNIILEQVTNDLQTIITESKTEIKHEKLPAIVADDTQIEQLFRNLIENAIKFKSTNAPSIIIECNKKKHEWIFKVKDNGIGIDLEFSERVFVIFQQLHPRDKCPGTGIGLTICKKIIERHGGRIWVESKKGKGSAFCFTIPRS